MTYLFVLLFGLYYYNIVNVGISVQIAFCVFVSEIIK